MSPYHDITVVALGVESERTVTLAWRLILGTGRVYHWSYDTVETIGKNQWKLSPVVPMESKVQLRLEGGYGNPVYTIHAHELISGEKMVSGERPFPHPSVHGILEDEGGTAAGLTTLSKAHR